MPRAQRPWNVFTRQDSDFWKVRWGGRNAPYEVLCVPRDAPRAEAEKEAAKKWLERSEAAALAAKNGSPNPSLLGLSIADLIPPYIQQVEANYTGRDKRYAARKATDLCEYIVYDKDRDPERWRGWKTLDEITTESWKEAMLKLHHSRGGPLRWRSIYHAGLTLTGFLRWCHKQGLLAVVPDVPLPSPEERETDAQDRGAMTEEQRRSFLAALVTLGEEFAHRVYTVLFETWQRKRTIELMTRRWVSFEQEHIKIPGAAIKNKKDVIIDMTPPAASAIRAQIAAVNEERAREGCPALGIDEPIFGHFDFHQARTKTIKVKGEWKTIEEGGVFGRACRLAGIDPEQDALTPHHVTRHTAATLAGETPGASPAALMAQGAWRSLSMVQKYLKPTLKAARTVTRPATRLTKEQLQAQLDQLLKDEAAASPTTTPRASKTDPTKGSFSGEDES